MLIQESAMHILGCFGAQREHAGAARQSARSQLRKRQPNRCRSCITNLMRVDKYLVKWNVEMRCKLHANAPVCLMRNDPVNRAWRNPLASRRGQSFFEQPYSSLRNPAVIMAEAEWR